MAIAQGTPVVLVNESYSGDSFNTFINDLGVVVVIFDEFAKVYKGRDGNSTQDALLSFFDGVASSKRLSIVIDNYKRHISEFLKDRPGRMLYSFEYGKLPEDVVRKVCEAKLESERVDEIVYVYRTAKMFTFDILDAIIEESNRFPEQLILTLIEDLNIDVSSGDREVYTITKLLHTDGTEVPLETIHNLEFDNNYDIEILPAADEFDHKYFGNNDLKYVEGNNLIYSDNHYGTVYLTKSIKKFDLAKFI